MNLYVCMHLFIHRCMYAYVHICLHACVHMFKYRNVYIFAHTHEHLHEHLYRQTYTIHSYTYIIYAYIFMSIHTHAYAHTHVHIDIPIRIRVYTCAQKNSKRKDGSFEKFDVFAQLDGACVWKLRVGNVHSATSATPTAHCNGATFFCRRPCEWRGAPGENDPDKNNLRMRLELK